MSFASDNNNRSNINGSSNNNNNNSWNHFKLPPICIAFDNNKNNNNNHSKKNNENCSCENCINDTVITTAANSNHRSDALAVTVEQPKSCANCLESQQHPCCCCSRRYSSCCSEPGPADFVDVDEAAEESGDAVGQSSSAALLPVAGNGRCGGGFYGDASINHQNSVYSRYSNSRDYFSAFQQQQQFAFFPNASEKVMANTRRIIVISIYISSLVLSIVLFLLAAVYCQVTSCSIVWAEKNRQYAQLFPICASCLIAFLSTCWLIANFRRVETSCMRDYSFLEMPSAVFSSLLAGVCAVIEIHYNFDYSYLYWSEKWALAAADAVILVFLHAGLAFALT